MPSLLGFYRVLKPSPGNGERCAGDVHEEVTNKPVTRFIQLSPKLDLLIV
jgi:hypothetical protein